MLRGKRTAATSDHSPIAGRSGLACTSTITTTLSSASTSCPNYRVAVSLPDSSLSPLELLRSLDWQADEITLGDIAFRLEVLGASVSPSDNGEKVTLYKSRAFIRNYERLLTSRPDFRPTLILELGIWGGGSVVLWNEVFRPDRMVGLDIMPDPGIVPLRSYVDSVTSASVLLHWQGSQDDSDLLNQIIQSDFEGRPPDLVIDDASHMYWPTRRSFEILFPLMQEGSVYVIEDWRSGVDAPTHGTPLHQIASDLLAMATSRGSLISTISILPGILVIERGRRPAPSGFRLTVTEQPSSSTTIGEMKGLVRRLGSRARR